jgi:predicted PurR-regulated permease PerM
LDTLIPESTSSNIPGNSTRYPGGWGTIEGESFVGNSSLETEKRSRRRKLIFLASLFAIAAGLAFLVAWPFLNAIVLAVILAVILQPLFQRLAGVLHPNWAALLTLFLLLLIVVVPLVLIFALVQNEAQVVYQSLKQSAAADNGGWSGALSGWADKTFSWIGLRLGIDPETIRSQVWGRANAASSVLLQKTAALVGSFGSIAISLTAMFLALFFFLRDGKKIVHRTADLTPLDSDEVNLLIERLRVAIQANVLGIVAVALTQAFLVGFGFWLFGVPQPALWALVASACSVIPIGGAALVWLPGAIYLLATHHTLPGVLLLAWGAGVVSMSDNFVRPWVLSGRVNLPPFLLFIALLGGVQVFGPIGIFLGPLVLSITRTFGAMLLEQRQGSSDS